MIEESFEEKLIEINEKTIQKEPWNDKWQIVTLSSFDEASIRLKNGHECCTIYDEVENASTNVRIRTLLLKVRLLDLSKKTFEAVKFYSKTTSNHKEIKDNIKEGGVISDDVNNLRNQWLAILNKSVEELNVIVDIEEAKKYLNKNQIRSDSRITFNNRYKSDDLLALLLEEKKSFNSLITIDESNISETETIDTVRPYLNAITDTDKFDDEIDTFKNIDGIEKDLSNMLIVIKIMRSYMMIFKKMIMRSYMMKIFKLMIK